MLSCVFYMISCISSLVTIGGKWSILFYLLVWLSRVEYFIQLYNWVH
jgi:hypothetical protein